MKKYILVDTLWELKRYISTFKKRWIVEVEPSDPEKLSKIQKFLFSYQLMEKPLVFIKSVEKWNKEELKWLDNALKESDVDVIMSSSNADILKKFGKFDDLSTPKPWEEEKWMKKIGEIANFYSMNLDINIAKEIFNRVGTDLDLISKEIEKLKVISSTPTLDDVRQMVPFYVKADLFEFVHLTISKDERAMKILKELVKDTHSLALIKNLENEGLLLSQLILIGKREYSWSEIQEISRRLKVKTPQIANLVGFSLGNKKSKNLLKIIRFSEIIAFLEKLQDVEIRIKNGEDPKFLLLNLVKEWTSVKVKK